VIPEYIFHASIGDLFVVRVAGNVAMDLFLRGYAISLNDNLSMNCTAGSIGNISIEHEKFLAFKS
jgi:hypothetical protein